MYYIYNVPFTVGDVERLLLKSSSKTRESLGNAMAVNNCTFILAFFFVSEDIHFSESRPLVNSSLISSVICVIWIKQRKKVMLLTIGNY